MPTNEQMELVSMLLDRPVIDEPKTDSVMRFLLDYIESEFALRKIAATRLEIGGAVKRFYLEKNSGH